MSCGHCEAAVKAEVGKVAGVLEVQVDLESKWVSVIGSNDRTAIAGAVDEAGFEATEFAEVG
jgi:copper chaperone